MGQDYNKYPNKFKSPQIHSNAMYCGKIKHNRMLFYHQNVSGSIKTHQNESMPSGINTILKYYLVHLKHKNILPISSHILINISRKVVFQPDF